MWMSFAEGTEFPSVYLSQLSVGIREPLISVFHRPFAYLLPGITRAEIETLYFPITAKSTQDFIRSIAEPVSVQRSMHHYSVTPYSLLGGLSAGYDLSTVLAGVCLASWKAACAYSRRSLAFSEQIEGLCIARFVKRCIELWNKTDWSESSTKFMSKADVRACFVGIQVVEESIDTANTIAFIGDSMSNMLTTTCLQRVLQFIFATYHRYGKFALVHGPATGNDTFYLLESTAPEAITTHIAEHFALSVEQKKVHVPPEVISDSTSAQPRPLTLSIPKARLVDVKSHIVDILHYSVTERYAFLLEPADQRIPLELRESTAFRPYQQAAWDAFAPNRKYATNGLIVLPCGAGKTLVGIGAICIVRRPAIVVCPSAVSVEQWRSQFLEFTTCANNTSVESLLYRCTSKSTDVFHSSTCVVLTTYAMLSANVDRQSKRRASALSWISSHKWGLVVFDEVHSLPAATFQRCIRSLPSQCVLGLTATLLREDNKVRALTALVGPKIFEATWWDLFRGKFIASVQCQSILCTTQDAFLREYYRPQTPVALRLALAACNPNKIRQCIMLAKQHVRKGDKVMVFSDSLHALRLCQSYLRCPMIIGTTPHSERMRILFEFQYAQGCGVLCISRVGDTSINLPAATVLIQISAQGGSRRQEMQRIGRLLRPKPNGGQVQFYSLISRNTHEEQFATKRREYLVQQGYACRLHASRIGAETTEFGGVQLPFSTEKDILDMLSRLVCKWRSITLEDFLEKKHLLEDTAEAAAEAEEAGDGGEESDGGVVLRRGTLTALSVDQNLLFSEYTV